MTTRIVVALAIGCLITPARSADLSRLPPMSTEGRPADVELEGREIEAVEVALRQFRRDRFSTSGDLKHFEVELHRYPDRIAVSFFPKFHLPSSRSLPGRNKYGTYITYFVSLRTLKLIGYTFQRD